MDRLEGPALLETIRSRPAMWLGGTDATGLLHMAFWAFDDILDNARAGRGTRLDVRLLPATNHLARFGISGGVASPGIEIVDDGPPLPLEGDEDVNSPAFAERLDAATLSMGDGPERGIASPTHVRSYLPVLRALSRRLEIHVEDGRGGVEIIYDGNDRSSSGCGRAADDGERRFLTRFWPDPAIFGDAVVDGFMLAMRLREMTATHAGYRATFRDEIDDTREEFFLPNGMADLLVAEGLDHGEWHDPHVLGRRAFRVVAQEPGLALDLAMQWPYEDVDERIRTMLWANTVRTREGTHLLGLLDAVRGTGVDRLPFVARLSVFVPQPRFSSPTKDILSNLEVRGFVRDHVGAALRRALESNPGFAMALERGPSPS